ncbi:MAG TPA: hypothetical protein VMV59_08885 [Candidatus Dormibacteraeota bacterium]|nr:hypothetical protein [Candidatus Dormibacteraeota bacterium]
MNEDKPIPDGAGQRDAIERSTAANKANRALYRWLLEFLRNIMVVAAIFYLAKRSGEWWLYIVASAGGLALAAYCYTYVENMWLAYDVRATGLRRHAVVLGGSILVQLILMGIGISIYFAIDKIVSIQIATIKGP